MVLLSDLQIARSSVPLTPAYHTGKGSARKFENREFITWDGEGITPDGETQQNYVLFGNSKGYELTSYALTTLECFQVMMDTEEEYPLGIHVGFGFSYDTEMILRDLPLRHMHVLHRNGHVRWQGYRIEYRKGKWLQVSKRREDDLPPRVCRIWDVWGFFSTSFVQALKEYLGADREEILQIASGKAGRKTFRYDELETIIRPYWKMELKLFVELMNSLRERLYSAGLCITNWHGPGAVATYAMRQYGVKKAMAAVPSEVSTCSRYAYAGGRFELFRVGYHHEKVYAYDIRSAYPAAIRELPDLSTGEWHHEIAPSRVQRFGLYRIKFRHANLFTTRPMPFPYRDRHSAVHFPNIVEGWYWSPEAHMVQYLGTDAEILEAWVYDDDGSKPFSWIEDIYNTRAQWKREGNPSQVALKLLMNSMYGKFAQRVGFKGNKSPTWHQLEFAGFITSFTRAKLFRAMIEAHSTGSLIGVETDGLFTSSPLTHVKLGEGLGDWELDVIDSMIYLQSGFYFKEKRGVWSSKYRGFDKDSVKLQDAIDGLTRWMPWNDTNNDVTIGSIAGESTRFTTMGQYLRMQNAESQRRVWSVGTPTLKLGTDGKRIHRPMFCRACSAGISPVEEMHDLTVYQAVGGVTHPHQLPWITDAEISNPFRLLDDGIVTP